MASSDLCWGGEWIRPGWEFGDGQDWAVSRSAGVARDPHGRWSLERRAVSVQRRGITWEDA